jgi:hypothetical protein
MKKFSSLDEAKKDYESKQATKVEISKPDHVETYDSRQKADAAQSKRSHPASS